MLLPNQVAFILSVTSVVFVIGLLGVVLNRKNILITIMSIELLLLSVNINFITLSVYLDDIIGHIFVIFILAVTAAESAVGLSILTSLYRLKNSINFKAIRKKVNKL